jgi:hypothetical protein
VTALAALSILQPGFISLSTADLAAVWVDRQMELAPAPARLAAMLLVQPIGGPDHLQPHAVDHDLRLTFFRAVATPRPTLRRENVVW